MSVLHAPQPSSGQSLSGLLVKGIPFLGMFVLALLLWLPFGFKEMGLIEEIPIYEQLDAGHSLFFITPSSVMSLSRSRPLQMSSFSAAYALDPNSYQFFNIFMMLFFFGKAAVVYGLVLLFLPGKKLLAFVASVLFMVYPGDTGLFALRVIHVHNAVLAYLVAFYLLVRFRLRRGAGSIAALMGAALLVIYSLGQYQIALAAAALTPFALLYFGRPFRRSVFAALTWYAAMAGILLYEVWAGKQPGITAYEDTLVMTSVFSRESIKSILKALLVGYERQAAGWATALHKLNVLPQYGIYLLVVLVVSIGIGWWLLRSRDREQPAVTAWWHYALVMIFGVVFFAIGLSIYLPLPYYRFNVFRIYLLAMLGSALVLTLGLYLVTRLLPRYRDALFLGLALPFIGLGFLSALDQHQYYFNASLQQQSILQQTARQAPQIKPNTSIVVLDRAGTLNRVYVFNKGIHLQETLRYLYKEPTLVAGHCPFYGATANSVNCQFGPTELHLVGVFTDLTLPYNQMLLFDHAVDGQLRLLTREEAEATYQISGYDPQSRIIGQTLPERVQTLFACDPALSCYRPTSDEVASQPSSSFDLSEADDIGFGWRETEYDENGDFFHWSTNTMPWIDVNLSDAVDLTLDFKVDHWLDEKVLNSLRLSVNDQDVPLSYTTLDSGGRLYHATIPRGIGKGQPISRLVFILDAQTTFNGTKLGFTVSNLRVRPA